MADTDNKQEDKLPEAEDKLPEAEEKKEEIKKDEADDGKDDAKDEAKDEDKTWKPPRIEKKDPGDGLPKETPQVIEFKWNKDMTQKKLCDTQHMLYLLQLALNLVRLRTIERNKYFKSIGRTDRYINQLDSPQIITNLLEWHNKDKEKNKFDGELLDKAKPEFMIESILSKIGGVKLGPAIKIYNKLKKDAAIDTKKWFEFPQPKLRLQTWGYSKMYKGEKVLDECTVEEMIQLLTYVNSEEKDGYDPVDHKYVQGAFSVVELQNKKKGKPSALELEENWKNKIIKFFGDHHLDGKTFVESSIKRICQDCMNALIPPTELNAKGRPKNTKLRGGVNQVLRALKGCYVDGILKASNQQIEI
eukprot:274501_1